MKYILKKRFSMMQVVGLLTTALLGMVTIGYAVEFAHDFSTKTGQVISGSEVMDNFNSLNEALPIMAASIDDTENAELCTSCPMTEVNSITMDIPADGFLVINGSCFLNNSDALEIIFVAVPKLDGAEIQDTFTVAFQSGADDQLFSLAYTVAVPVAQGVHTISQDVGPYSSTQTFYYNRNNLTAVYYPAGQGSTKAQSGEYPASTRSSSGSLFGNE